MDYSMAISQGGWNPHMDYPWGKWSYHLTEWSSSLRNDLSI